MPLGSPAVVAERPAEVVTSSSPGAERLLRGLTWVLVAGALAVPLVVWGAHLGDAFQWDHVSGVWLALGEWADRGVVVPPLHEGPYFAGTRYLPIPIALLGLLVGATGQPVVAGRVFTLVGTLVLAVVLYRYARLLGASALASVTALVLLVSTPAMTQAVALVRNDTASVAFGLAALMTVHRLPASRTRWLVAGVLAALAASWKISELWPVAALACFAVVGAGPWRVRVRDRLGSLAAGFGASLVVLTVIGALLSGGRFFAVLGATLLGHEDSVLGVGSWGPRLVDEGLVASLGLLLPLVLLGWVATLFGWRRAGPLAFAVVFAAAVTGLVYVDRGAGANHFTAVVALGLLGLLRVSCTWSSDARQRATLGVTATALALVSCWATWDGGLRSALAGEHPAFYVAGTTAAGPVLTEDPTVSVLAGDLPVVADPFAFRRLSLTHPSWPAELDARIAAGEFSQVVLLTGPVQADPEWYERQHFGRATIAAICADYHSTGTVADGRYETFAPGAGPVPATSVCARASY